jgi:hypothetical protein
VNRKGKFLNNELRIASHPASYPIVIGHLKKIKIKIINLLIS